MPQLTRIATCLLIVGIFSARAAADPIHITEGQLTGRIVVTVQLSSADGSFMLVGSGDVSGGNFGPWVSCSPCAPGTLGSIDSVWGGTDFHGQASIDGTAYRFPGSPEGPFALVDFSGPSWVVPEFQGDPTVSIVRPFSFTGLFLYPFDETLGFRQEDLFGFGVATVNLSWEDHSQVWGFAGATYTFTPEPIPEPASMLLFGTGLVALGRAVRQRRRAVGPVTGRA